MQAGGRECMSPAASFGFKVNVCNLTGGLSGWEGLSMRCTSLVPKVSPHQPPEKLGRPHKSFGGLETCAWARRIGSAVEGFCTKWVAGNLGSLN